MEPQVRILDGSLDTMGLQSTLKMLALSGKTGVLSVTSGPEKLAIFLNNGQIVDLDEPGAQPPNLIDMFRLLDRLKHLPRNQVVEMRHLAAQDPHYALALLVQTRVITPAERQRYAEFRIIQAISRSVRWERGHFEFHRDVSPMVAENQKSLDMDHVLLEAIRMADEWSQEGAAKLSRDTIARWMPEPEFVGDVTGLELSRDDINVLSLSNGQYPLHAIAYALLIPEPQIALSIHRLERLGLVEVIDPHLELELERNLANLLTQSQHMLSREARSSPDRRMLTLIRTMGTCVNGLLAHHATYARELRGRGEVPHREIVSYIASTFTPLLTRLQREYPRMEDIIRFTDGQIDFHDIETLDRVVRGQELVDCYWDALQLFSGFMRLVFERIIADEVGKSRAGRQYEDLWAAFLREISEEIACHFPRQAALHMQETRMPSPRPGEQVYSGAIPTYQFAPNAQRRSR